MRETWSDAEGVYEAEKSRAWIRNSEREVIMSEKKLVVSFDSNDEPQFKLTGAWNIKDLGHTRSGLFRAYKHYMKELRQKEETK